MQSHSLEHLLCVCVCVCVCVLCALLWWGKKRPKKWLLSPALPSVRIPGIQLNPGGRGPESPEISPWRELPILYYTILYYTILYYGLAEFFAILYLGCIVHISSLRFAPGRLCCQRGREHERLPYTSHGAARHLFCQRGGERWGR